MVTLTPNQINVDLTTNPISLSVVSSAIDVNVDKGNVIYNIGGGGVIYGETPSGTIDGSNATFTSQFDFIISSLQVFLNGIRLKQTNDYTTSGTNTILLNTSPTTGELLLINYLKL